MSTFCIHTEEASHGIFKRVNVCCNLCSTFPPPKPPSPPPFLQLNYFQINIHFIFKCLFTIVAPAVLINAIEKKLLELLKHFTCSSHII